MNKLIENNNVELVGEIVSNFTFSHKTLGEGFYIAEVAVKRLSETLDYVPLLISERLIDVNSDYTGKTIHVNGQFRSFNLHEGEKNHLVLSVFVMELELLDDGIKTNQIFLDGYICKDIIYRATPLGREVADLLLAVNRSYGKTDYIPCIVWGRNARFVSRLEVGGHIRIFGRIQSREYIKKISEMETENHIAYEVSASRIEVVEDGEE
jgi:primosomal replication protein N